MLFNNILIEKDKVLNPEFDRLLDLAIQNQSHECDLLLIYINGHYSELFAKSNLANKNKFNPHAIGLDDIGHSESAHYSFIHKYRTQFLHQIKFADYLKLHEWTEERSIEIDKLVENEETSIQLEMLIYLKFWEADLIIKKFYELVRILNGEPYDWYFKVNESGRDKNSTGSRQDIIRLKIRDQFKTTSPIIYELIKKTYITQIRNAIAHSNYSFLGRYIHLNNFIEQDKAAQLKSLHFDEWIDIFHNTMVLYNNYIRMNNIINQYYQKLAEQNDNKLEIKITEKDGKNYPLHVEYRADSGLWGYYQGK